ncbi:MAG TPA: zinc ribbon domain-containing protein [Mycobacterium sp.]|nr:zinc ribbon domain-containing protein [Mycobacterium sp.]
MTPAGAGSARFCAPKRKRLGVSGLRSTRHTSDGCEVCGHAASENRVTQAEFRCTACGHGPTQADEHAARNLLRAGLALHAQAA